MLYPILFAQGVPGSVVLYGKDPTTILGLYKGRYELCIDLAAKGERFTEPSLHYYFEYGHFFLDTDNNLLLTRNESMRWYFPDDLGVHQLNFHSARYYDKIMHENLPVRPKSLTVKTTGNGDKLVVFFEGRKLRVTKRMPNFCLTILFSDPEE